MATTVGETVFLAAAEAPSTVALRAPGHEATDHAHLAEQVRDTAAQLHGMGLHAESRVAVVLPGGPELAACLLAVTATVGCAPINPRSTAEEIAFVLADIHADAVIVPLAGHDAAESAASTTGCRVLQLAATGTAGRFRLQSDGRELPIGADRPLPDADSIALLLHTSGTTARPKLVGLRHRQLLLSARSVADALQLGPADRSLVVMPLFHVHGIVAAMLAPLVSGGEVVAPVGFAGADLPHLLATEEPTWITAVPTILQALVQHCERTSVHHRLRVVRACSSALPPSVADALEHHLGVPVVEAYGMTEGAHQIACHPLPPAARRPGSVGVSTGPRMAIVDDDGATVPAGTVGEVVLLGPSIITGYVENPAADETAFRDGWFRTGDLGRMDEDGYLFLVGRSKELVNRGGEKIAPREVEDVLLAHPAVQEAIVFGVPDARLGEQVAAAVTLRPEAHPAPTDQQLRIFAAEHLATAKVPRRVVICDEIPKGPTGKPQRRLLAELLQVHDLDDLDATQLLTPRAPDGPLEELLAEWWQEVLRNPVTDANLRFLDAGGDSLAAIRLLALVRNELDVPMSIIELFDAPTIAQQALLLEHRLLPS